MKIRLYIYLFDFVVDAIFDLDELMAYGFEFLIQIVGHIRRSAIAVKLLGTSFMHLAPVSRKIMKIS